MSKIINYAISVIETREHRYSVFATNEGDACAKAGVFHKTNAEGPGVVIERYAVNRGPLPMEELQTTPGPSASPPADPDHRPLPPEPL